MNRIFLILFLVILVSIPVFSQSEEIFGVIVYADGFELSIFREGELLVYDVVLDDVFGLPVLEGDMVLTDDDTFLEIQLSTSQSILKIAENTSFQIQDIGASGGASFEILYGRVRAKVAGIENNEPFQIRGRGAVAGVRGTDFGYDYVLLANGDQHLTPTTRVYCFEGSVEVATVEGSAESIADIVAEDDGTVIEASELQKEDNVIITANEMIEVQPSAAAEPIPVTLETQELQTDVKTYWEENSFRKLAISPDQLEREFPGLKNRVSLAKARAVESARKRAEQNLLVEGEKLGVLAVPEITQVESIPSIQAVNAAALLPSLSISEKPVDNYRAAGFVLTIMGIIAEAGGGLMIGSGPSIFGTSQQQSQTIGTILLVGGGISLISGISSIIYGEAETQ